MPFCKLETLILFRLDTEIIFSPIRLKTSVSNKRVSPFQIALFWINNPYRAMLLALLKNILLNLLLTRILTYLFVLLISIGYRNLSVEMLLWTILFPTMYKVHYDMPSGYRHRLNKLNRYRSYNNYQELHHPVRSTVKVDS